MHEGELTLDDAAAAGLIAEGFPDLAGAVVRRLEGTGTVNRIYRVGDAHVARFPLVAVDVGELRAEAQRSEAFADAVSVAAPRLVGVRAPSRGYPSAWSLQTWVHGTTAHPLLHADDVLLARDVADLVVDLRTVAVGDRAFDGRGRGGALPAHDEWVATCLHRSSHLIDAAAAGALWDRLRALPAAGPDTMSHRDLTPFNLLVTPDSTTTAARLSGVLDAGGFGPADRALDLVAAWHLFDAPARRVLRDTVGADDREWCRGAAWALQQALGLVWYYADSNPGMSALGRSTVRRLLADGDLRLR